MPTIAELTYIETDDNPSIVVLVVINATEDQTACFVNIDQGPFGILTAIFAYS